MNTASHLLTDVDPSQDAAEADLAAAAYRCLSAALDHSNAPRIALVGDDGIRQDMPVLALPPRALRFLAEVLKEMALQRPVVVMPQKHELSTQEAAAFLNVSRPFVIKEIEAGRLKCRKVNRHRRIEFAELQRYQQAQQATSEQALQRLNTLSEDLGLEF